MRRNPAWLVIAGALASQLGACTMLATKGDYADYRAVRLAPDAGARQLAMQRYVARHPDGRFHEEVQRARQQQELATFQSGRGTRAGLEHYLAAFPDGELAPQARSRLAAIDLIDQRKREAEARAATLAAERSAREVELRRTWITRFAGYWINTLLALKQWGAPIPEVAAANPAFSRAFGAEPRPRCTATECVKYYEGRYAVPVPGGTRLERTVQLVLRLRMQNGKLERAELLLPGRGFARVYEQENATTIVDSDPDSRKVAVDWMLARLPELVPALKTGAAAEPGYELAPIAPPALGPTGEATDTAAEDPSVPPNRLREPAAGPEPSVEQLVKPNEAAPPDMVFAPMQVDQKGHEAAPSADMVMAPVAVPGSGTASTPSAGAEPGAPPPSAAPAAPPVAAADVATIARATRIGDLRLVVFAGGSAETTPYDGVLIERISPTKPKPSKAR